MIFRTWAMYLSMSLNPNDTLSHVFSKLPLVNSCLEFTFSPESFCCVVGELEHTGCRAA